MNNSLDSVLRAAVRAPLCLARPVNALGAAVWLYLVFVVVAGTSGWVIRVRSRLARDLAVPESDIDAWLARLVEAKLVTVQSSHSFLVVKIRSWPGGPANSGADAVEEGTKSGGAVDRGPVYGDSSADAIALGDKSPGDRGQGEGELREAIRTILPDAVPDEIDRILGRYPQAVLWRVLHRVDRAGRIRKSQAALFRYLLGKFSQTIDVNDH